MSLFEKNPQTQTPKIKLGFPCQNCPHTHKDHSYYSRVCLIDGCTCPGMKYDPNDVTPIKAGTGTGTKKRTSDGKI